MFEFIWPEINEETQKMKEQLVKEGRGTFYIVSAEPHIAKSSGNKSIKINMKLLDMDNKECWYTMYASPKYPVKLKLLCEAIGKGWLYTAGGALDMDQLSAQSGECTIKTEVPKDPQYPKRSVIDTFIIPDNSGVKEFTAPAIPPLTDDDIPF